MGSWQPSQRQKATPEESQKIQDLARTKGQAEKDRVNFSADPKKKTIPTIDLSAYRDSSMDRDGVARSFREANKEMGFFYVKNHGVPDELIDSIFTNADKFFRLSREQKMEIKMDKGGSTLRGYYQIGEQITSGKKDYQQGIYLGRELDDNDPRVIKGLPFHGKNLYPSQVPELKRDIQEWLVHMNRLGGLIMEVVAESLGLRRTFFSQQLCRDHYAMMILLHYPKIPEESRSDVQPLGEHCDYGFITMLMGTARGLQAKNVDNEWIDVDPVPGCFMVNIGDLLEKATRGLYKSTPHRVVNYGNERLSIPYFYSPGFDQKIFPLDFQTTREQAEMMERTRSYKRIDQANIQELNQTIGQRYIQKEAQNFPELFAKYLRDFGKQN